MWTEAWLALAEKYSLDMLRAGLKRWCTTGRFLPLPADVEDSIKAARGTVFWTPAGLRFEHCGKCVDGHVVVDAETGAALDLGKREHAKRPRALRRCACWQAYLEEVRQADPSARTAAGPPVTMKAARAGIRIEESEREAVYGG